jgi:hypothetical protein
MSSIQLTRESEGEALETAEAALVEAGLKPAAETPEVPAVDPAATPAVPEEVAETAPVVETLEIDGKAPEAAEVEVADGEVAQLHMETFYNEYAETGTLSAESSKTIVDALTSAGIGNPEAVVAQYMAGAQSQVHAMRATAFDVTGGEEQYGNMATWAGENLSAAELDAYSRAVADPSMVKIAATGLYAQYQAAVGAQATVGTEAGPTNPRVQAGVRAQSAHAPLNSQQQIADLVSDPSYMKDPGFRATADARIQASMSAGLI